VSSEVGGLFGAQNATVVRWDGDTIRVIGSWAADAEDARLAGAELSYGGDTITARVVETAAPARVDSAADPKTEFGRRRWAELWLEGSIGACAIPRRGTAGAGASTGNSPSARQIGHRTHRTIDRQAFIVTISRDHRLHRARRDR
jgi:hypothetical protein